MQLLDITPPNGSVIDRADTLALTVEDSPTGLGVVVIYARYPSLGVDEMIWDGLQFAGPYDESSRVDSPPSEQAFTLHRAGGWLDTLEILVVAVDAAGAVSRFTLPYEVTGTLGEASTPPATRTFAVPSLTTLIDRVRGDFRALELAEGVFWDRSLELVLSRVIPGLAHGLHGHIQWVSEQLFPDRSGADTVLRWARIFRLEERPASPSVGTVVFSASTGASMPAGEWMRRSDGATFEALADADESGGVVTVSVQSIDTGSDTVTAPSAEMTLQSPVAGIASVGVVDLNGLKGGRDADDIESMRARVLDRFGKPPRGGSAPDYRRWALEVESVAAATVIKNGMGPGSVLVVVSVAGDDPTPPQSVIDAVQAKLDLHAPGSAVPYAVGPQVVPVPFTIAVTPDTPAVRAAVLSALRVVLESEGTSGATIPLTHLAEAISGAAGEYDHELIAPTGDVVVPNNSRATLGDITWTPTE